jgi:uncharacterized membrane protein YdjX (TVP38/TMEM64 family)
MAHPKRWLLAIVVLLVIGAGSAAAWVFDNAVNEQSLTDWIAHLGMWAPFGFVLLYAVATVAMVPGSLFDLAGGALFGPYVGSLLDLTGGSIGAALAFLVARYVARDWVEVRAGPRTQGIMRNVEADGWQFVAFLRLVPVFPYNVINYLLGLTRIPFHHYIIATVVFMAPSTLVYTYIGHAGREAIAGDTDNLYYALLALGLLGAMLLLPRFYKRWRGGRQPGRANK